LEVEKMKTRRSQKWILLIILLILLLAVGLCAFTPAGQFGRALVGWAVDLAGGAEIVQSVWSPDMEFEAYVVDYPSIDPPNQRLFIQRRDEQHFVVVAQLGEDVDSIETIHWSPAADMVVFETRNYLYAVHTPGFEMTTIPLANEFFHYRPGKFNSFGGGISQKSVEAVTFPEPGVFAYQLEGETAPRTVRMAEMLGYQP
jgi:hypothetical protein